MKRILLKRVLLFLVYSISLFLLWRLTIFGETNYNKYTCFLGLGLTVVGTYWIQKENKFEISIIEKLILLIFPLFFYLRVWSNEGDYINFRTPLFIGIILIVLNLFLLKNLKLYKNFIFFFLIIYSYSSYQYEGWQRFQFGDWKDKNIIIANNKITDSIEVNLNLKNFKFLDPKLDTVRLINSKPYSFILTWSEYCKFCKTAFKEINPTLDEMNNFEKYYLYSSRKFDSKIFLEAYSKEEYIYKRNVIADFDFSFTKAIGIYADPTFVIIDNKTNKIVYLSSGYSKSLKDKIIEEMNYLNSKVQ